MTVPLRLALGYIVVLVAPNLWKRIEGSIAFLVDLYHVVAILSVAASKDSISYN